MRSKNYGINVRVTEQEKQKLLENARFCSLPLSEYLRRLGLGKDVKAAITERDYRLFRMLNGLKAELPQLQKEEILSRLEAILNELSKRELRLRSLSEQTVFTPVGAKQCIRLRCLRHLSEQCAFTPGRAGAQKHSLGRALKPLKEKAMKVRTTQ